MGNELYSIQSEKDLKQQLNLLFDEWKEVVNRSTNVKREIKKSFITDGFYPYYLQQKIKVLFIGRESYSIEGDYIEVLSAKISTNNFGYKSLNDYSFFNRQFYLAYGLNHGLPKWDEIPPASEMPFGVKGGLSFAFMNLSKFSNWSDVSTEVDKELLEQSLALSVANGRSFLAREIELLNPDFIITMNIGGHLKHLGDIGAAKDRNADVCLYYLASKGRSVPLLDMWHFSAINKNSENNYYLPMSAIVQKHHLLGV